MAVRRCLRLLNRNTDRPKVRLPRQAKTLVFLRHLRHALPVQPDFADAFYPRKDVIDRLAADPYQLRSDDASHKIAGKIENLLRSGAFESFA